MEKNPILQICNSTKTYVKIPLKYLNLNHNDFKF